MKKLKKLFLKNTPTLVSLIGVIFAVLLTPLYLNGWLDTLDNNLQDSFYTTRFTQEKPHKDIVIIAITEKTIAKLGWPIPRSHYVTLLNKLQKEKPKVLGFNILIATKNKKEPTVDQALFDSVKKSQNTVMPFFYDYSTENSYTPVPELEAGVSALGHVSTYPGSVAHYVQAELFNSKATPRQVIFPMGLEMARIYLGLKNHDMHISEHQISLDKKHVFPLESGKLRINYQGEPGYFKQVAFDDVLEGKSKINFKDKMVFLGAFSPSLGDITTSPYGDQTIKPFYGTELQAHMAQAFINNHPVTHAPPIAMVIILILLGASLGFILPRFALMNQILLLLGFCLSLILLSYLTFNFGYLIDTSPFLIFSIFMAVSLTAVIYIRSQMALNEEIDKVQEVVRQLPETNLSKKVEHILTTFLFTSQSSWVTYRQFDAEKKQLTLREVKSRDPEVSYEDLPPYFAADFIDNLPNKIIPHSFHRLPQTLKDAYGDFSDGLFILMPLRSETKAVLGMFEIYFSAKVEFDDMAFQLIEDLYEAAQESLNQLYSKEANAASDIFPGVEQKIESLSSLYRKSQEDSAFFNTVLRSTNNPVVVCNQLGEVNFYNENFVNTLRLPVEEDLTHENIMELMGKVFSLQAQQWQDIWQTTIFRRRQKEVQVNTEWGVYHLSLTPVIDEKSQVTGVVMVLTDVTKLHRQANYDKLTGLYNRRYFDELLMKEFQRCQRDPEKPFSMLLMDIDHFKSFNDTYGHQVGDQVLASFGQVLQKAVRRTDMAVRYGGEEMAVILPLTTIEKAVIVAEKVRRTVESMQLYDLEGNPIRQITVSIGVAQYNTRDPKPEELTRRADDALYKCKGAGRNCIHIHNDNQGIEKYNPSSLSV